MIISISLILAILLTWPFAKKIKRHAAALYFIALAMASITVAITWENAYLSFPGWIQTWIWPMLAHGAFATALFILVMFAGAFPPESKFYKKYIPIRMELSIIASILTLGHNIGYGKTYFVRLFTEFSAIKASHAVAAVCSMLMIVIMLPLAVTSFPSIRKKMNSKAWKRLQRTAYCFYGLIYLHTMMLYVPIARTGSVSGVLNVAVYSMIFFCYAGMRIQKAIKKRGRSVPAITVAAAVVLCGGIIVLACQPWNFIGNADRSESIDSHYADGTYEGKGEGYNGIITVSVCIEKGKISDITVVSTPDDSVFWKKAVKLIDVIEEAQSANVDGISGATYSSNGLKNAVEDALGKASVK